MTKPKAAPRYGFESSVAGKVAECDGGSMMGPRLASRQDFRGTLTGQYVEEGDPPWRWYLMQELTLKPEAHVHDSVWCEVSNIFMADGHQGMPPGPGSDLDPNAPVARNQDKEESQS